VVQHLICPAQIRAARALLNINQAELAVASRIGIATIKRLELAEDVTRVTAGVLLSVQTALEEAGISFIFDDGVSGIGVRYTVSANAKRSTIEPVRRVKAAPSLKPRGR